jgi:hypothetical protein
MEPNRDYLNSERLDRLEQHQRLFKEKLEDVGGDVRDIKNAIMGNPLSSEQGIAGKLRSVEAKVDDLEEFKVEVNTYVKQFKWAIAVIVAFFSALGVAIIKSKSNG